MRRCGLLVLLGLLASTAAAAWPEGRYVGDEASRRVDISSVEEGVELRIAAPLLATTLDVTLVRDEERGLLHQPERERGWFGRLVGREPKALPFDGERLVFAREEDGGLIVTTLEVDERGRPTVLRLALLPEGENLRFSASRFDADGISSTTPLLLQPLTP